MKCAKTLCLTKFQDNHVNLQSSLHSSHCSRRDIALFFGMKVDQTRERGGIEREAIYNLAFDFYCSLSLYRFFQFLFLLLFFSMAIRFFHFYALITYQYSISLNRTFITLTGIYLTKNMYTRKAYVHFPYTRFQCYMHSNNLSTCYVTWSTSKCEHNRLLYGQT